MSERSISTQKRDPSQDRICITCLGSPRIVLEVECPGIRSAGDDQIDQARKAITLTRA